MTSPRAMWADVDTGIDDALALIYLAGLHHLGEVELVGVSCSAGNVALSDTVANTRWLLRLCNLAHIPVVPGLPGPAVTALTITPETHGRTGLGYNTAPPSPVGQVSVGPASAGMAAVHRAWAMCPASTTLVITGPLTAFEAAVRDCPQVVAGFDQVVIMGGAVDYPGNTTPFSEWNFWVDPEATASIFSTLMKDTSRRHSLPRMTLCSLGVTETITVTNADIDRWRAAGLPDELHGVVRRALRFYFEFHQSVGEGYLAQVHDLFAVMVAAGTAPVQSEAMSLLGVPAQRWQLDPEQRGRIVVDGAGVVVDVIKQTDRSQVLAEFERSLRGIIRAGTRSSGPN